MFRVPKHGGGSSSRVIKAYGQPKIGPPVKGRRSRCFGILFSYELGEFYDDMPF